MKLPELRSAEIILSDKSTLTILNPVLARRKGMLIVKGFLDRSKFKDDKELSEKLNFRRGRYTKTYADLFRIVGICDYGCNYEMFPVDYNSFNHGTYEIEMECYGIFKSTYKEPNNTASIDYIHTIVLEGAKMYHSNTTETRTERVIFGKVEHPNFSSKRDFTEARIKFYCEDKLMDLSFAFIEGDDKLLRMRFESDQFDLEVYDKVKFSLISFLSFAFGNNIVACQEHLVKDSINISVIHSYKSVKKRHYSNFIPLNNISFLHDNFFDDYLKTFNTFFFLDKYLALSEIVLLLNYARKSPVDTSVFIMLIAIEKLADKLINSPFCNNSNSFEMDNEVFKQKISNLREIFEKEFQDLRTSNLGAYNNLNSKLGAINKRGKTDNKIWTLLDFAEIQRTEQVESLFPGLRNIAIHQGEISLPTGDGYENQASLELLLNRIIVNLIQYKGIKYIKTEGATNIVEKREDFKTNYEDFGFKSIN